MGSNRLNELVKKSVAGTITDVEKAEMEKLADIPETMKKSVTFAEFTDLANAEIAALAVKGDAFRASLLKSNSEAAVAAVAKDKDAKFDIEVVKDAAKVDSSTQYAGILDGLTKIQASIESLAKSLVKSEPVAPPAVSKDAPAAPPVVVETKAAPTVCPKCGADMGGATVCPKCGYDAAAETKAKKDADEAAAKKAADEALGKRAVFSQDIGRDRADRIAKAAKDKSKGK